jgi:hypothetical protein
MAFIFSAFSFGHSIFAGFHSVSQTFASLIDFNHVTTYHIDQFEIFSELVYFGKKYHTSSASICFFELINVNLSHFFISQENTFTYDTTHLYISYWLSNTNAFSSWFSGFISFWI